MCIRDRCKARGLEFYAVNKDYPEEQKGHQGFSRKLKADMFIDCLLYTSAPSLTGTFLMNEILGDKDRVRIEDGAIVTIGATTFILQMCIRDRYCTDHRRRRRS